MLLFFLCYNDFSLLKGGIILKKFFMCLIILIMFTVFFIDDSNVYALDNTYGIFCSYTLSNDEEQKEYFFSYTGSNLDSKFTYHGNLEEAGIDFNELRPYHSFNSKLEKEWLIANGILTKSGKFTCPSKPFGKDLGKLTYEEYMLDDFSSGCPEQLKGVFTFLKYTIYPIIQIGVPILLILMGCFDMARAVMASDEKQMKEAYSRFIRRAIAAVMVFFVTTIVSLIMNLFDSTDSNVKTGEHNWADCWTKL